MPDTSTDLAAVNANLAKGEWWLCVLAELIQIGFAMTHGLMHGANGGGASLGDRCVSIVKDFCRFAGAVHRAIALSQRIERALRGLRALRACTAEEIADARAAAELAAEKLSARRDRAREAAEARRAARGEDARDGDGAKKDIAERVTAGVGREAVIVSVEPAYVDLDTLELRKLVERICADLRITPPWDRWQAEAWLPPTSDVVDHPGEPPPPLRGPVGRMRPPPPEGEERRLAELSLPPLGKVPAEPGMGVQPGDPAQLGNPKALFVPLRRDETKSQLLQSLCQLDGAQIAVRRPDDL